MLDTDPSFQLVRFREDYPPLEDLGLIGDGATVALVGLDGGIYWLCLPRFDSEPVFCGLLDRDRGGHFTITPDGLTEARQCYEPDTGVLVTELRSPTGLVRLTDALALRSGADLTDDVPGGRGELVRSAVVLDGSVRLRVELEPRGGAQTWMAASGLRLNPSRRPDLQLHLRSSRPLSGLHGTYDLRQGDSLDVVLSWGRFHRHHRFDAGAMLAGTAAAWRRWMTHFSYAGLQEPLVRRAAITLKLCDH
jgi:GH15 family glucan-1,4-alpha-glucosidase